MMCSISALIVSQLYLGWRRCSPFVVPASSDNEQDDAATWDIGEATVFAESHGSRVHVPLGCEVDVLKDCLEYPPGDQGDVSGSSSGLAHGWSSGGWVLEATGTVTCQ